jgi:hypothetical protein
MTYGKKLLHFSLANNLRVKIYSPLSKRLATAPIFIHVLANDASGCSDNHRLQALVHRPPDIDSE